MQNIKKVYTINIDILSMAEFKIHLLGTIMLLAPLDHYFSENCYTHEDFL